MAATVVTSPYPAILDLSGEGLTLGSLYIGAPNTDPQTNPQAVYWDAALTIPATQPLAVSAGYIMRTGAPAVAFTSGDYSIRALDHLGVQVFYRATSLNVAPVTPPARTLLTANTSFYVTSTGSDTNGNGSAGNPWQSIQKAFNVLQSSYDLGGFTANILVGPGVFAPGFLSGPIPGSAAGSGSLVITGAGVASTTVRGPAGTAAFAASAGATFSVFSMTLGGTGDYAISANQGAVVGYGSVTFAAVAVAHLSVATGAAILCAGSYTISGGAASHFQGFACGTIGHFAGPYVCTLTGTPAFSFAFASASDNAVLEVQSGWLTFSGAATGARYAAAGNATIDTFSSGANYFPGNSAGFTLTNGVYA